MAELNFPQFPDVGNVYQPENGLSYRWDGVSWNNDSSGPSGYTGSQGAPGIIPTTFETLSKNIRAYPYVINRSSGIITSVVYSVPSLGNIVKTFTYSSGTLISVSIAGAPLNGLTYTKTLAYTDGIITGASYTIE